MTTTAWVIGARGLLGNAIAHAIGARDGWQLLDADPLPWSDHEALASRVGETTRRLLDAATAEQGDWAIIWAAGAAVTATTPEKLAAELAQLTAILDTVGATLTPDSAGGTLFYASSAGGLYGGSANPPYTELSEPVPISPYGRFKLQAEGVVDDFARRYGVSTLVGRIANLYGPGQKLEKMQGLISQIARAQFSPTPAAIYVSLDTVRDYIFVTDCALLVLDGLDRVAVTARVDGPTHITKILASGQGVTIGALLGHFRTLSKGHPHVMLGASASSSLQALDLRLQSVVWPELDARQLTPLPAGIHATMQDILNGLQSSRSIA